MSAASHPDTSLVELSELLGAQRDAILQSVGGLQLFPENATKWIRFERLVEAARASIPTRRSQGVSGTRLRHLLSEAPVAAPEILRAEDQFEHSFVASIKFYGGEYLAISGGLSNISTGCQLLLEAVRDLGNSHREIRDRLLGEARLLLRVSDTICRRVGLRRWQLPEFETTAPPSVPPSDELERFRSAVVFCRSEIEQEARSDVSVDDLLWPHDVEKHARSPDSLTDDRACLYPFDILTEPGRLVVPLPSLLTATIVHRLLAHAVEQDLQDALLASLNRVLHAHIERHCQRMAWRPIRLPNLNPATDEVRDALYLIDVDKVAHVVTIVDHMRGYQKGRPCAPADARSIERAVHRRMLEVRKAVRASSDATDVMHVAVTLPLGRVLAVGLGSSHVSAENLILHMTLDDLEVMAHQEKDDSLGLWKFARAVDSQRSAFPPGVTNSMDLYALYRDHKRSFYMSDEVAFDSMFLLPGYGAEFSASQRQREDSHAALLPLDRGVVSVSRWHTDDTAPIYLPDALPSSNIRVVELALPVWVSASADCECSESMLTALTDALAFWVWHLRDEVDKALELLSDAAPGVGIELAVQANFDDTPDTHTAENADRWFRVDTDVHRHQVMVQVRSDAGAHLSSTSNATELKFVAEVVAALLALAGRDRHALDRRIRTFSNEPAFRALNVPDHKTPGIYAPDNLPPSRLKHEADLQRVSDQIGAIMRDEMRLPVGTIPPDQRIQILGQLLTRLDEVMQDKLARLEPQALFQFLIEEQEQMHNELTRLRVVPATQSVVFGESSIPVQRAVENLRVLNSSAAASRYIAECAVRSAPQGAQPVSFAEYDELLAIAQQIVNLGALGDALHNGTRDAELSLLPSGRLGIQDDDAHDATVADFVRSSAQSFVSHVRLHGSIPGEEVNGSQTLKQAISLDDAFRAEFGLGYADLNDAVSCISDIAAQSDRQVVSMNPGELAKELMDETGLEQDTTDRAIELLTLKTSDSADNTDIFAAQSRPWRYSRDFSLLRRPLVTIASPGQPSHVMWGVRSPWIALQTLLEQINTARLRPQSPEMEHYIQQLRSQRSRQFVTKVADLYRQDPNNQVTEEVTSFGNLALQRENGQQMGDIDVLVINRTRMVAALIEAKDYALARTAQELGSELDKLFESQKSAVSHHLERVKFVRSNWTQIHRELNLDARPRNWQIHHQLVTSEDLLASHLMTSRRKYGEARVMPYQELAEQRPDALMKRRPNQKKKKRR